MAESSSSFLSRFLGDLVIENTRAAALFEQFGLDYCCHGHRSLEEAARDRGIDPATVAAALESLGAATTDEWSAGNPSQLSQLTRLIVERHHRYVREATPAIRAWLDKLVSRHAHQHPELVDVRAMFRLLSDDLATHMMKEENIVFPFIDALAAASRDSAPPASPFGTISNPLRVMEADHNAAGELLSRLRSVTNGYMPPADACTTYRLCFGELARFEADLHRHIHLENNVLFPRALALEQALV